MSETKSEDWPASTASYPQCPPADAEPATGVVFRLYRNEDDWKTYRELGKARSCLACGFSVFRDLDRVRSKFSVRANSATVYRVFAATLEAEHGRLMATGSSGHYTLWLRRAHHVRVRDLFSAVS
jgi:hypothetical protein